MTTSSPPVFTSRRDPDAAPFSFVVDVEREVDVTDPETKKTFRETQSEQHTFTCRAQLNAGVMLDVLGAGKALGYDRLMAAALVPGDRERWTELIREPDVFVDPEDLEAAVKWVVEQYVARPTKRPSTSSGGPQSSGSGSTDTPPSADSTSEPSPPTGG